jgi:hypothetical protein
MIPFASQRGGGQDLATHLMNAHDNEQVVLLQVRGAIARDLHGAFAEWEAIAKALTRARQYLCSLSINPDELQGRLTRAQYLDYIERAEKRLGLTGQPRAIIFHVKQGDDGRARQHCHVIWSRTDVENRRAIPLSFFKEKMMTVTREFARDYGLTLPPGYDRQADEQRRNRQLSAYDCVKQKETGISHEERMAAVSDAWRRSDGAKAFVAALEDLGYVLARGRNKTRIVLVDFYGHTTALSRLIDDASVRAKHVRDFLGAAFAPDRLPTVEQAQALATQRRAVIEAFEAARLEGKQEDELASQQAMRREEVEAQARTLRQRQHDERVQLAVLHKSERQRLKASYLAAQRCIRIERARRRPRGLAAFLGRVSGVALIIRKVQRHRDRKRYAAYLVWRDELKRRQEQAEDALAARHALQMADIRRRLRALDQIEQREWESRRQARRRGRRQRINARYEHMPALAPVTPPPEQSSASGRTPGAPDAAIARQMAEAAQLLKEGRKPVRLTGTFVRPAGSEEDAGVSGDIGTAEPSRKRKRKKRVRRRSTLRRDFQQAASGEQGEGEAGGESSKAPKLSAEPSRKRRRRRKRKPRDGTAADDRRHDQDRDDKAGQDEAQKNERQRRRRQRDFKPSS